MKRRAIRIGKKRIESQVRNAVKESRRLHRVQYNAPLLELEKPYQRGWMRYLHLSDRANRRPEAERLEELLHYVDHIQLSRTGKFDEWVPREKRRVPRKHRPRRISLRCFLTLKIPTRLYRYFRFTSGARIVNDELLESLRRRGQGASLEVNCEHLFESRTVPYYVTHQRVDLPEVKSQSAFLDQWLEQRDGWFRFERMNGHRVSRWNRYDLIERQTALRNLHEKEMRDEQFAFNDRTRRCLPMNILKANKGTTNVVPFGWWRQNMPVTYLKLRVA
ncbi:MAG: hypothetical protein AAGC68_13765 [Verrucomicrobiota bacterium]